MEIRDNTHLVINRKWLEEFAFNDEDSSSRDSRRRALNTVENIIDLASEGKPNHRYLVVNRDEPYADEVLAVILRGEAKKLEEK